MESCESEELNYTVPEWAAVPLAICNYSLEVIKDGCSIEKCGFEQRKHATFIVIGRSDLCDIKLLHPSISRYHCILQYGSYSATTESYGWYIFDLNSTHRSKLNKITIEPSVYKRLQVGHVLQFGLSSRLYVVDGPQSDKEQELEYSPREIQLMQTENLKRNLNEDVLKKGSEEEKDKDEGISWGMDFPEDETLTIPMGAEGSEDRSDRYMKDPVKVLSNYFDREGFEMEFIYSEMGRRADHKWACSLDLPMSGTSGMSFVSASCIGSKKDAQIKCALEACRILDMTGELFRARNDAKRRRNMLAENDFYDSDEDIYFDRTGQIEHNREARKRRAVSKWSGNEEERETYESLLLKIDIIEKDINLMEEKHRSILEEKRRDMCTGLDDNVITGENSITPYQRDDQKTKAEKSLVRQRITLLKHEKERLEILARIVKPVELPKLTTTSHSNGTSSGTTDGVSLHKLLNMRRTKSIVTKNDVIKTSVVECTSVKEQDFVCEEDDGDDEIDLPVNLK